MRIPRIFEEFPLQENSEISLGESTTHRLQGVLRLRVGYPLIVFNGQGGEYEAKLLAVEKHKARIRVSRFINISRESTLKIHLVQGIPRAEKMDTILQKSVELGVASIAPVMAEYSIVRLDARDTIRKTKRWYDIIVAACEQSGRNKIPTLYPPQALLVWLEQFRDSMPVLLLHPFGSTKLKTLPTLSEVGVVVGPEGGFSKSEVNFMQKRGFYTVSLGPRILRTETASVGALSALQTGWGDF